MSYKDNYKSIQLNLKKDKHKAIIKWLENTCDKEEQSLNSLIIKIIKEHVECQKKK